MLALAGKRVAVSYMVLIFTQRTQVDQRIRWDDRLLRLPMSPWQGPNIPLALFLDRVSRKYFPLYGMV
jgi:hypothetical protein